MGLIFYLSSRPGLGTGLGTWDVVLRKLAHVTEYAILAVLLSMTFTQEGASARGALFGALVGGGIYAISDELHQTFVPDRHGSPIDVLIDTVGLALGAGWIYRRNAHMKQLQVGRDEDDDG